MFVPPLVWRTNLIGARIALLLSQEFGTAILAASCNISRSDMYEPLVGKLLIASSMIEDPIYSRGVCLVVHEDEHRTIGVMLNRPMQPSPEALMKMMERPDQEPSKQEEFEKTPEFELEAEDDNDEFEYGHEFDSGQQNPEEVEIDDGQRPVNRLATSQPSPEDEQVLASASGSLGLVHFGGPLSGPVVAVHGSMELGEAEMGHGIYVAAQKQNLEDLVRHKPTPYRLIVGHLGWEPDQLAGEIEAGMWHLVPATADAIFDNDVDMWQRLIRRATAHSVASWIGTIDVPQAYELN